jgi:3-methyladenine DNA glycosylase AlkD
MPAKSNRPKPRKGVRAPAPKSTQKRAIGASTGGGAQPSVAAQVRVALSSLERMGTARDRANLDRFGITASKVFGVSMANVQVLARRLGGSHELAAALWETGWYEARMLAAFVDEPERVTAAQMDRWCRDFDNWAICDTLCFKLFDRTPHAWAKAAQWALQRDEFVKRAGFAMFASLALHDRAAADEPFVGGLKLVERAAGDERNFVKKGVSWALRAIGRRNAALNEAAVTVARRLADSHGASKRWVGRDALKELTSPMVRRRLAARRSRSR